SNPNTISPGQSSTLTWTTTNSPTAASISPFPGAVSPPSGGSRSVPPVITTTYTLTVTNGAGSNTCQATVAVVNRPYLRVFGGDVQVGTSFSQPCTAVPAAQAKILTFNLGPGGSYQGAGAQMAVFALGTIDQFVSANGGGSPAPKALTFANTSGTYGGNYNKTFCAPDYWADATSPVSSYNVPAGVYTVAEGSGQTIYVDGNAIISGNILYANSGGWTGLNVIPSYKLIVRGNIYIDRGVTQLDGTFIALANGGSGGKIYTCTAGGTVYTNPYSSADCNNTLTVNGSFIANEIKFLRTRGTLNSPEIAEIFRYGPEVWAKQ
ncbi:hypothetical protein H0X10_01620, partial [Candidatus Saccharibacteria bacterium]|nr:hypothetical protein [Candidatus Saccharibacteria bacterium]